MIKTKWTLHKTNNTNLFILKKGNRIRTIKRHPGMDVWFNGRDMIEVNVEDKKDGTFTVSAISTNDIKKN